jgi:hypothetical protein
MVNKDERYHKIVLKRRFWHLRQQNDLVLTSLLVSTIGASALHVVGDDGLVGGDGGGVDDGGSGVGDLCDESALAIDVVLDGADGSISLHQTVLSLGEVSLARFLVRVDVLGVVVVDGVLERVLGGSPLRLLFTVGGGGVLTSVVLGQAQGSGDQQKGGEKLATKNGYFYI